MFKRYFKTLKRRNGQISIPILFGMLTVAVLLVGFLPAINTAILGGNWTISGALTYLANNGYAAYAAPSGTFYTNTILPNADATHDIGETATRFSTIYAPIGRAATLTVAAADSSARSKAQADYVCDDTADDEEIQAAIDALTPGRTWIETVELIGSFSFSSGVTVRQSFTRIQGRNATITFSGTTYAFDIGETGANATVGDRYYRNTIEGIRFESDGSDVENHFVLIQGMVEARVIDCSFYQSGDEALLLTWSENCLIQGNYFEDCSKADSSGASIYVQEPSKRCQIIGNNINSYAGRQGIALRQLRENTSIEDFAIIGNVISGGHIGLNINATSYATSIIERVSVIGNNFDSLTTDCIQVGSDGTGIVRDITIVGNTISSSSNRGVDILDASDGPLLISANTFRNNNINIDDPGATIIVRGNSGHIVENSGTGTITSGTTSVTITHGLSVTPTIDDITVLLAEDPTNSPGAIWVDTITSTQFNINCENDPGASNLDLAWKVTSW